MALGVMAALFSPARPDARPLWVHNECLMAVEHIIDVRKRVQVLFGGGGFVLHHARARRVVLWWRKS